MRIRKIKFLNERALGNLEFDFVDANNRPYETIIFVGVNGVGKTTILKDIETFIKSFEGSCSFVESVEYEHLGKIYNTSSDGMNFSVSNAEGKRYSNCGPGYNEIREEMPSSWKENSCFLVDSDTDCEKTETFNQIMNSLKHIQNADIVEYVSYNTVHNDNPQKWSDFIETSRTNKIAKAINFFFDGQLEYFGLGFGGQNEIVVGFKKYGKNIASNGLSSGEKQIVYKAVSYLMNNNNAPHVLLLDEPELGLHPAWQKKILGFYQKLVSDQSQVQKSQIFVSTHSPYILAEFLRASNTLIYRVYEDRGIPHCKKIDASNYLFNLTYAEVNYLVFDIPSPEYHNQLFCEIQNRTSRYTVAGCDAYIAGNQCFVAGVHGKQSTHGNTTYQTICSYIRNAIDHFDNGNSYTREELVLSIELMQQILRTHLLQANP